MATIIQQRSDTAANWASVNPILAQGESGFETDTNRTKIGNGATAWNSLLYWHGKGQVLTINTTGGPTVITQEQGMASYIRVTGVLTSNVIIVVNDYMTFVANNATTGAYSVEFKVASGGGTIIGQGKHQALVSDGADCEPSTDAGAGSGDVVGPITNTDSYIPQWDGTDSKTLKGGIPTSTFAPALGVDDNYVTDAEKIIIQDLDAVLSAGVISAVDVNAIVVSSGTAGAVDTIQFYAWLRTSNSISAPLVLVNVAATTANAITSDTYKYIICTYSGGSGVISVASSDTSNGRNIISIALVENVAGVIHMIVPITNLRADFTNLTDLRWWEINGIKRASGALLGSTAALKVSVTSGVFWSKLARLLPPGLNTNITGTFSMYYVTSGVWTEVTGLTTLPVLQYNNITTGLVSLTNNNYYSYYDVYFGVTDGDVRILYGQGEYTTSTAAQNAPFSAVIPVQVSPLVYQFVGRYIWKKNAAAVTDTLSAYTNPLSVAGNPTTASQVSNVPAGSIAATDVQAAINELDTEKQPLDAQLTDLAALSYTGNTLKVVRVNAGETAFELATASGGDTLTSEGALINSATEKTTPVDADMVGLMDSAASNILKKLSWANIEATLKTYFDTLYASGGKFKLSLAPGAAELTGASHEPILVGLSGTHTHWSELKFNDTTVNYTDWIIPAKFTAAYAGGTVTLRIRWKAAATTGKVLWKTQLLGRIASEQIDTTLETARAFAATTVDGTTEDINNSELTFTPSAAELTAGDMVIVRITRQADDGTDDTMTGDAKVISVELFEV